MRQISFDEAAVVGGAACGDLTMSIGLTGVSITGSLSNWGNCFNDAANWASDAYNSYYSSSVTGIPYGEAHVG